MSTKINSLESIVAEMAGKSVTAKWDAILYYNRAMSNNILLQQYIEKFAQGSWWPPISGEVQAESQSEKFILKDVVFSEPILSFESQDEFKVPVVKLTWLIVGGSYLLYSGADLIYEVNVTPLGGHKLSCYAAVSGGNITDRSVYLDIEETFDFVFESSSSDVKNKITGTLIRGFLIAKLTADKKKILISEIESESGGMFNPTQFKIETKLSPNAKAGASDYSNDGAVVVHVALDNNPPGGTPSEDMYLIPDDDDYSATIVISNKVFISKVLKPGLDIVTGAPSSSVVSALNVDVDTYKLDVEEGSLPLPDYDYAGWPELGVKITKANAPFGAPDAQFKVMIEDGGVHVNWAGEKIVQFKESSLQPIDTVLNWRKSIKGEMKLGDDSTITMSAKTPEGGVLLVPIGGELSFEASSVFDDIIQTYGNEILGGKLDKALQDFGSNVPKFNTATLQSILFENSNVIGLKEVRTPSDLIVFGAFRPSLNSFEIIDPMPCILKGAEHQFLTNPASDGLGLKWDVVVLASERGIVEDGPGTITEKGLYKAPETLKGNFMQVKITATSDALGAKSYALLSVGTNEIEVSPTLFKCDFESTMVITANTVDKAELDCDIVTESKNKIERKGGVKNTWVFTAAAAPAQDPADPNSGTVSYLLDKLKFSNSSGASKEGYALCVSKTQAFSISFEVNEATNEINFKAMLNGKPKDCDWKLLVKDSNDNLDEKTGVYTRPSTSVQDYIAVSATHKADPDLGGVDIFRTDFDTKSVANLIRSGQAPIFDKVNIEAAMKTNDAKRNKYCK